MIYCVDSHIIIWGIKKQAVDGQKEMIQRAGYLFETADSFEDIIIVPSLVIAEILSPEPAQIRAHYLEIIKSSFIIAPFDTRASLKYSEMLFNRKDEVKKIAEDTGTSRQKMKIDHMIIATAIVNEANCIYSTDAGLKAFAEGYIDVRDLPPLKSTTPVGNIQKSLFDEGSK